MSTATKWTDPFEDMSDEEFDEHVDALFSERPRTVAVSLRVPNDLLERLKRQAHASSPRPHRAMPEARWPGCARAWG